MSKKILSSLEPVLKKAIRKYGTPGATLAIWHQGQFSQATAGVLNVETGEKVRAESIFQIGSVTKVLTAHLIMKLVDEGLLELDKPVRHYVKDFRIADPEATNSITIKQLLDHSSGMSGDFFTDTGSGSDCIARYVDRCTLLPLSHPVGDGLSYSNSAYTIAGRVAEVVTGMTYHQALHHYIFDAMDLKNAFSDPKDMVGRSVSSGHAADPENPKKSVRVPTLYSLSIATAPAGSTVMMSAEDLINFARTHLDGGKAPNGKRLLKKSTTTLMQKKHNTVPVPPRDITHWGLGWFLLHNGEMCGHDGATVGQYAYLRVHKETSTIVALLTNGGTANDLMMDVFAQTFDKLTGIAQSPALKPSRQEPTDLEKYVGIYRTVAGDAKVYLEDGKLMITRSIRMDDNTMDEPPGELKYADGTDFLLYRAPAKFPATYSFLNPDEDGIPTVLYTGLRVANRVR